MNIQELIAEQGKISCCGCTACRSICPKQCISMEEDPEGFLYPHVDTTLCIDCEACVKVCPFHNPVEESRPESVFAAINENEEIRRESSSGGIFTMLAEKVINEGGVVFGARYTDDWQVEIVPTETTDGIAAFRGSKYLQARMGESMKLAKKYLQEGRKVLFSGTPCQIAGLRHYLRKDYDNLLAVDFVCHGVPSPKVWQKYLAEVSEAGKRAIKDIKFRDKPDGWKRFNFTLSYDENAKAYSMSSFNGENHYMRAFLSNMILRPSCYYCLAKCGRSHSDITIADFWGIEQVLQQMDDDRGTSLLMIRTAKGKAALDFEGMKYLKADYEDALRYNPSIEKSVSPHRHRADFFARVDTADSVIGLIDKELRPSAGQQLRNKYHHLRHAVKMILKMLLGGGKKVERNIPAWLFVAVIPQSDEDLSIVRVSFRSKQRGWKHYDMKIGLSPNNAHSPKC